MFISDKFIFNGIHSDDMGVALVTFDSNVFNEYGLNFNSEVSLNRGGRDMSHFVLGDENIEEVKINIALIDKDDNPIPWDNETIMHITNWLITDSFVEFVSEDNVELSYFFKTVKIVKNFNYNKEGYLEITFQPFSNYAYMKYNKKITVYNSNSFRINNPSASNEVYKPIIKIKTFEDTPDTIIIENETNGCEPFIIQNLNPNEVITVDSLLGTVYNDKNENLLMNCNRKWLNLNRGENKINILGNAEIDIKCQFPVVM